MACSRIRSFAHHLCVYNCVTLRNPTRLEMLVGQGMCTILLTILDVHGTPIANDASPQEVFEISVELWAHETLKIENLLKTIETQINFASVDIKICKDARMLFETTHSERALNHPDIENLTQLVRESSENPKIMDASIKLETNQYKRDLVEILIEGMKSLSTGTERLLTQKFEKINAGKESRVLLFGYFDASDGARSEGSESSPNSDASLSSNDLQLRSMSTLSLARTATQESESAAFPKVDPNFARFFSTKFIIIHLEKYSQVLAYNLPSELYQRLHRLVLRWLIFYDIKAQNVLACPSSVFSPDTDKSLSAAVDTMEAYIRHKKSKIKIDFGVPDRLVTLSQWMAFPLAFTTRSEPEGDSNEWKEWNDQYCQDIGSLMESLCFHHSLSKVDDDIAKDFYLVKKSEPSNPTYYYRSDLAKIQIIQMHLLESDIAIYNFSLCLDTVVPSGASCEELNLQKSIARMFILNSHQSVLFEQHVHLANRIITDSTYRAPSIFQCLRSLHQHFPKAPRGSRSFLVKGLYQPKDPNVSSSLFQYIFTSPQRYGFYSLSKPEERAGCYISSPSPDFRNAKIAIDAEDFKFTILVYPAKTEGDVQSQGSIPALKYYVLVVSQGGQATPSQFTDDSTSDYITAGYYLHDVVRNAEKRLSALLDQVRF